MNKDMIYHIFKEAPKSRNVEIIKFLKEYKQFRATCLFSGHAPLGDRGFGDPDPAAQNLPKPTKYHAFQGRGATMQGTWKSSNSSKNISYSELHAHETRTLRSEGGDRPLPELRNE